MTARKKPAPRKRRPDPTAQAEAAGAQYAQDQLQSDYFSDWIRDQLLEASRMDPNDVLPLETKKDAEQIAHNMLQQLEWDTKRDLCGREIKDLIGSGAEARPGDDEPRPELVATFYDGFHEALKKSREWLADELLQIKGEMGGEHTGEAHEAPLKRGGSNWRVPEGDTLTTAQISHFIGNDTGLHDLWLRSGKGKLDFIRANKAWLEKTIERNRQRGVWPKKYAHTVRDYIAVDRRDHPVGPRHKGYSDAKREADAAGGVVKFVPSGLKRR